MLFLSTVRNNWEVKSTKRLSGLRKGMAISALAYAVQKEKLALSCLPFIQTMCHLRPARSKLGQGSTGDNTWRMRMVSRPTLVVHYLGKVAL